MQYLESYRRSLMGERVQLAALTLDPPPEAERNGAVLRQRWAKRIDAAQSMAFFRYLIDGSRKDFRGANFAENELSVEIENFIGGKSPFIIYLYVNTAPQFPATLASFSASCRAQSNAALAQASCACLRFRRAEGRWPVGLTELVPAYLEEVPLDAQFDADLPVSQDRLRYRLEGDDAIVYSLGFNRRDDGGLPPEPMRGLDRTDFTTNDVLYRLRPSAAESRP